MKHVFSFLLLYLYVEVLLTQEGLSLPGLANSLVSTLLYANQPVQEPASLLVLTLRPLFPYPNYLGP